MASSLPKEHPFVHQAAVHSVKTSTSKNRTIIAQSRKAIEMARAPVLTDKFNVTVVPFSMMPDGLPLPGTLKENWSEEALNYRSYF